MAIPWGLPPVTFSANDVAVGVIVQELAIEAGVSIVIDKSLAEQTVSVEFTDVPGQTAFEEIGRLVKRTPTFRAGLVTFPEEDSKSREAWGVVAPGYLSAEQAVEVIKIVVGSSAEVAVVGQRVVVAGTWDAVKRASEFALQLHAGADGWMLEVRLVRVTESLHRALGLGWDVTGGLTLSADAGTGSEPGAWPVLGARGRLLVEVLGRAAEDGRGAELVQEGRVFCLEGESASMQVGETTPVPRRTVSPEGTVTTTGYEQVRTGFILSSAARRVPGGVRLDLEPTVSSISGYVDGAPIVNESSVTSSVIVEDGGWVVLSGLRTDEASREAVGLPGGLHSRFTSSQDKRAASSRLLLLVRAQRVWSTHPGSGPRDVDGREIDHQSGYDHAENQRGDRVADEW